MLYPNLKKKSLRQLPQSSSIEISISSKQSKNLNVFWIGFIVYTLGSVITQTGRIDIKICQAAQIVGLILFFSRIFTLIEFKFDNTWLKFIYILYCAWLLSVIWRGSDALTNYSYIKDFFFNPYEGMLYFAPFLLLFPRDFIFFKKIFDIIIFL